MTSLGHCDALEGSDAAILLQQLVNAVEVGAQVLLSNSLEHLNRDDLVVWPLRNWEGTVILEADLNAVRESGFSNAFIGQRLLLLGQGEAGDTATSCTDSFNGKGSPASSDLQDVVGRLDLGVVDETMELGDLSFLESLITEFASWGRLPDRARVSHVRRQKCRKHVIADIIMSRDIQQSVGQCVGRSGDARDSGRQHGGPGGAITHLVSVEDKQLEKGSQVGALNLTKHVSLGKAHVGKQESANPESVTLDDEFDSGD